MTAARLLGLLALAGVARAANPESMELWAQMALTPTPAVIVATLTLTPAPQVRVLGVVTASLTVSNTGQNALRITGIAKAESDPLSLFGPASGFPPALPVDVPGGTATTFVWTYQVVNCGALPASVSASVYAADVALSQAMPTAFGQSNGITAATIPTSMVVNVIDRSVKVGGMASMTVQVLDSCIPAVGVVGEDITLAVITGDGKIVYRSGPTDATGSMRAMVATGLVPGMNAYLVADPNLPGTTVFVEGAAAELATPYLSRNFINPARGERVQVRVSVPVAVRLCVRVFNLAGELVRIVKECDVQPGLTVWEWDGRNGTGAKVGNGTYFIQIQTGTKSQMKKVIVLASL